MNFNKFILIYKSKFSVKMLRKMDTKYSISSFYFTFNLATNLAEVEEI